MVEQVPVTLVGGGRVGRALAGALGPRGGLAGPVVRRGGRGWDEVPPGRRPVLLCTGAQHLEEAVSECPPERRPDLVFMQNGALEPWLAARGLEGCTRALLYLSAEEGGAALKDGGGRSSVTGPWAVVTREALGAAGIGAREVPRRDFGRLAFEKLLWSSVFWCLSAGRGGVPVGELVQDPGALSELEGLVAELLAVRIRAQFGRIFELAECRRWLENALNFLRSLFSVYLANLGIVKKRAEGGGQV